MRANCYHYEFQHSLGSQGCLAILFYLPSQLSLLCSMGLFLKLPPLSPCSVRGLLPPAPTPTNSPTSTLVPSFFSLITKKEVFPFLFKAYFSTCAVGHTFSPSWGTWLNSSPSRSPECLPSFFPWTPYCQHTSLFSTSSS